MSAFSRFPSLIAVVLVFFLTPTHLDAKTVIVDDTETDKIKYSSLRWKVGPGCPDCLANVDRTRVNTWHDGSTTNDTTHVDFLFTFTGTSVEVKHIALFDLIVGYSIDSTQRNVTVKNLGSDAYNQTLLKEEGLANVQHTLKVDILSKPSSLLLDYILYDDGSNTTSSTVSPASSTSLSTSSTDNQPITGVSSGSSPNIGAIVGGVVAGVAVGVALIWYLRRRSQQTLQRGIFPFLRSRSEANGNANAPLPGAETWELPGSHYYAPSGTASQVIYNPLPTSEAFVPQPPPSSQTGTVTESPSGARTNSIHAPSTTPSGPSAMTKSGNTPSNPGVHRGSVVHALGVPPTYAPGPTTAGPPSSPYSVASNRVQSQIPNEPVEEGLMSGRRRGRYP